MAIVRTPALAPRDVLVRTLSALNADLAAYVLLALVLVGVPTVISDAMPAQQLQWVHLVVAGALQVLLTTTLTHSVLARLNGKPATVVASVGAGLRFWPLAFGVQLVSGLGVLAGLVLLVVPGVVLALRWLLPVPVLMTEQTGLADSLRRSTALTDGFRWPLLRLLVAWVVVFMAVPTVLIRALVAAAAPGWEVAAADMVFDMAGTLISAAGIAVVYVELCGPAARPMHRIGYGAQ